MKDYSILEAYTKAEREDFSPRNSVDGSKVYFSRHFHLPNSIGNLVLTDLAV